MKNINYLVIYSLFIQSLAFAQSNKPININEFVLPSETETVQKNPGAIYYSKSVKNKVLIPTHFWGEFGQNGLHFIPTDTTLIAGISIAGGPRRDGELEDVTVKRLVNNKLEEYTFDLTKGGGPEAYTFKLQAGDAIHMKRSYKVEDRIWLTSLIGVFVSALSGILIYEQINE